MEWNVHAKELQCQRVGWKAVVYNIVLCSLTYVVLREMTGKLVAWITCHCCR